VAARSERVGEAQRELAHETAACAWRLATLRDWLSAQGTVVASYGEGWWSDGEARVGERERDRDSRKRDGRHGPAAVPPRHGLPAARAARRQAVMTSESVRAAGRFCPKATTMCTNSS
jgi:hypothetical protein